MLPLRDPHVRLVLLNHLAARLQGGDPVELLAAGIERDQLDRLRGLSTADLHRLAAMRDPIIRVAIDNLRLRDGLSALSLIKEAKALEAYFIRHGASWTMMKRLFKVRHKVTLRRRREYGVRRLPGRMRLPDGAIRERIWRAWMGIKESSARVRYYRLHQAFGEWSLEALERVVRELEREQ